MNSISPFLRQSCHEGRERLCTPLRCSGIEPRDACGGGGALQSGEYCLPVPLSCTCRLASNGLLLKGWDGMGGSLSTSSDERYRPTLLRLRQRQRWLGAHRRESGSYVSTSE